jgi:beta-lactamase superfamily II metal-dependent hydrolase
MPEDFAINVDFAALRRKDGKPKTVLAWGDPVRMLRRDSKEIEVEVVDWVTQRDGSVKPITSSGFLKRKIRVEGKDREVALPAAEVRVLRLAFVDVQQGDGAVIQTPKGRLITIDGGENKLFARFLAGRYRGTSDTNRREIDAMVVSHGDADHFAGLPEIHETETDKRLPDYKRIFVHPKRVFHNGLVKRPESVGELKMFGATEPSRSETVITELESDLLAVPASEMNKHFKAWRRALAAWAKDGAIEFRRLAKGDDAAFDFLADEQIEVEVLGPIETKVGRKPGLRFLRAPRAGVPMAHLDFEPGSPSASHTVNGHSIVLRLRFKNFRMLFAGDLNNAAEETLTAEHEAGRVDLEAEVFKVPHHGSHEFTPGFMKAVSPLVSIVSSGDEQTRTEHIHPRATLMSALGRYARDDSALVFVTEMVAFFEMVGPAVSTEKPRKGEEPESFFGFRRSAFGCVRVRTDGEHMLVFTDTGKRDIKEAYAYDAAGPGAATPVDLRKA